MAASKSMLESLLARVRQRAAEPRTEQPPLPRAAAPQPAAASLKAAVGRAAEQAATSPPPVARPAAVAVAVEEEIEEYDDELIEILDDGDVSSDSEPPPPSSDPASAPLELRAPSAPSVEMRRRAVPPSSRPNAVPAAREAVAPAAPAASAPVAAARLRAEVVGRRPVPATAVVQSHSTRPDPRGRAFLELLDASLDLGKQ